ncbi:MAG: vitamin K epoxide reductase family protein [Ferruginibacter sp.]
MAQSFNTNLSNVAKHYIKMLKVSVTPTTLTEELTQNPYYPSLYSIRNVFNKLSIANEAYQLTAEDLNKIEPPFIAYCSDQNTANDFVLVTKFTETSVSYIAENSKPRQVTKEEFLKQWQKTIFIADPDAQSGENDFAIKQKVENLKITKQNFLYTGAVLIIGLMVYMFISSAGVANIMATTSIIFINLLGIGVTVLLLMYEIDKTNSFVKNICTAAGKQTSCDAVLNSKAAKLLGMGWGEVGFFYFAAITLFLLFPGLPFTNKIPWLAIAGTLAAPYILFSIYYQWQVVKKWCLLCLAVQAILLMELIWAIKLFWIKPYSFHFTLLQITAIISCIVLPIVIWYLLKPYLSSVKNLSNYESAYKRLLHTPVVFSALIEQQNTIPDGWQDLGINIGNPNAKNTIIKICNPFCNPCSKAHHVLERIIKNNAQYKLKIIFNTSNEKYDLEPAKIVKLFLALSITYSEEQFKHVLDDWYLNTKIDPDKFLLKYPVKINEDDSKKSIDKMFSWVVNAKITHTPMFFINGKQLSEYYTVEDIENSL